MRKIARCLYENGGEYDYLFDDVVLNVKKKDFVIVLNNDIYPALCVVKEILDDSEKATAWVVAILDKKEMLKNYKVQSIL